MAAGVVAATVILGCTGADLSCPTTPDPGKGGVRLAVIGDYGADSGDEQGVSDLVHCLRPDLVATVGDNDYFHTATIDDAVGQYFHDFIGGYRGAYGEGSPKNRFWPTPGNHDWDDAHLAPYLEYFALPGNERYYEVDAGLVRLFALDSDPREPDGAGERSAQAKWLERELGASTACFNLITFHHAPYGSGDFPAPTPRMRWPFVEWGADAVLTGHVHVYERLQIGGIPYFVTGNGGYDLGELGKPVAGSRVRDDDHFGAMLVTATTEGITYEFYDTTGERRDSLWVPARCDATPNGP